MMSDIPEGYGPESNDDPEWPPSRRAMWARTDLTVQQKLFGDRITEWTGFGLIFERELNGKTVRTRRMPNGLQIETAEGWQPAEGVEFDAVEDNLVSPGVGAKADRYWRPPHSPAKFYADRVRLDRDLSPERAIAAYLEIYASADPVWVRRLIEEEYSGKGHPTSPESRSPPS